MISLAGQILTSGHFLHPTARAIGQSVIASLLWLMPTHQHWSAGLRSPRPNFGCDGHYTTRKSKGLGCSHTEQWRRYCPISRSVRSTSRCPLLVAHELSPLGLRGRKNRGSRFFLFAPFSFFVDSVNKWITQAGISCSPPQRRQQRFTLGIVMAKQMRAESDAESLIKMLMYHHPTFSKRDAQMGGLDLKDEALKGECVVVAHGSFLFDGEDQIQIEVGLKGNKSGSGLPGFDGEALVKLADEGLLQEKIGGLFCFDAVQTKLVTKSVLESCIDAFAAAPGLRGISRDGADAQFCKSPSYLRQMALLDRPSRLGGQEEVSGPVRIQGAEDAMLGNAVFKEAHAAESAFFIDEFHFIDFACGIVHQDKQIEKDARQIRDPFVSAAIKMEHHADEWFSGPSFSMFATGFGFFNQSCCLQQGFDEGIASTDSVMVLKFLMEMRDIEALIVFSVKRQNPFNLFEGGPLRARSSHAAIEDTVITVFFVPDLPTLHGPVRNPDNIGRLSPEDLLGSGL